MKRFLIGTCFMAGTMMTAAAPAAAQLSANVQISWHWSDDGWRSSGPVVDGYVHLSDMRERRMAGYDRAPARARILPAGFRVPPGHMPPSGMCRVWFVGVPPGHQPPPQPCVRVFRSHHGPDAIILHAPGRYDRDWRDRQRRYGERWDEDDWDDDRNDDWRDDWDDEWDDDDRSGDRDGERRPDRGRRGRGGRGGR